MVKEDSIQHLGQPSSEKVTMQFPTIDVRASQEAHVTPSLERHDVAISALYDHHYWETGPLVYKFIRSTSETLPVVLPFMLHTFLTCLLLMLQVCMGSHEKGGWTVFVCVCGGVG